ncbi:VOC family protein [Streptomyces sp. SPB4]|uniref:VOC family protein n=1 Tax=Streptomyces sp. SPB4 TaxID=2940553 RepID=UPI0024768225|nr:VOC family protein [Streptomyces sp. SPB4]MDH6537845.1 catechol 2,3-dioxygenase-like lactoylglutathione lyase family enzyme [Streptomyces sp. SPB4]
MGVGVSGVAAVTILVTDLARSTRWYCDVLDLVFIREFAVDGALWGVVLLDTDANFVFVLQDKGTTPGVQDLRGTRPVVLAVPSRASVDNMVERLRGMGLGPRGPVTDPDGTIVDVTDPDGIILRFRHVPADVSLSFQGVSYGADGSIVGTYHRPHLQLPPRDAS